MARLVKAGRLVLDLARFSHGRDAQATIDEVVDRCSQGRKPPITPHRFDEELKQLRFTNAKADSRIVYHMYARAFESKLSCAKVLEYQALKWGNQEAADLAAALPAALSVREIHLQRNFIGDAGLRALARAIEKKDVAPQLVRVWVESTPQNEAGKRAIADALAKKKEVRLREASRGASANAQTGQVGTAAYSAEEIAAVTRLQARQRGHLARARTEGGASGLLGGGQAVSGPVRAQSSGA